LKKQRKAAYNVRSGLTVALIVVMTSLGLAAFSHFSFLRPYLVPATICLGVLSLALYCFRVKRSGSDLAAEEILQFYYNPGYWSFVITVTAVLTYGLFSALFAEHKQAQPLVVQASEAKQIEAPPAEPQEPEPVVVLPEFPPLHVTGLILNGTNSSAVINRLTVQLGETINEVKVVDILPEGVVVELAQQRKTPLLGAIPELDSIAVDNVMTALEEHFGISATYDEPGRRGSVDDVAFRILRHHERRKHLDAMNHAPQIHAQRPAPVGLGALPDDAERRPGDDPVYPEGRRDHQERGHLA